MTGVHTDIGPRVARPGTERRAEAGEGRCANSELLLGKSQPRQSCRAAEERRRRPGTQCLQLSQ